MNVVFIYADVIVAPPPVAASVEIIRGDDPVGVVSENNAPRVEIQGSEHNRSADAVVVSVRIVTVGLNSGMLVVPSAVFVPVLIIVVLVPTQMASIIVVFLVIGVLVLTVIVVMVVLPRNGAGQRGRQR